MLSPPYDDRVLYSFHCYEPIGYTHQLAYWMPELRERLSCADAGVTPEYFEELFAPALHKADAEGTILYCGEYGVIDTVDPKDSLTWFRAIHEVFERYSIPRCLWTYRKMDFGLSDSRMDGVRSEVLKYL